MEIRRFRARSLSLGAVALAVGLLPLNPLSAADAANGPPTGELVATFATPSTHFFADLTDPDGDPLTYEWVAELSCGSWHTTPDPDRTRWDHPNGAGEGECPHDTPSHPGTVTVYVTDGTYTVKCERQGSLEGTSPCELLPPALSLGDGEGKEGETIELTASLDRPAEGVVTFNVDSLLGSAPSPACPELSGPLTDYELPTKSFQIPAGQVTVPVPVRIIDDPANENTFVRETGTVELLSVSGAAVGKYRGEFAITEDDIPDGVEWSDKRVAVKEGGRRPMLAIIMRRRGLPKAGEVVVSYRTIGGTAKVGRDYKRLDKTLRWKRDGCTEADSDSKTVKLVIKDDKKKEKTERLFVELHDPKGVIIGPPARLRVAILDND